MHSSQFICLRQFSKDTALLRKSLVRIPTRALPVSEIKRFTKSVVRHTHGTKTETVQKVLDKRLKTAWEGSLKTFLPMAVSILR